MHQIVCRLGLCPRPTGGAYITPADTLAGLGVGLTGNGEEGGEEKRREGREGRGTDGKGVEGVPECPNPDLASLLINPPPSLGNLLLDITLCSISFRCRFFVIFRVRVRVS